MFFDLDDSFTQQLPADPVAENYRRQVRNACFSYVRPKKAHSPELIHISETLASELGINKRDLSSPQFLKIFSGNELFENTRPYSMCYGGHQFGHWAGQLGDGRAINLFQARTNNKSWTYQLKGAGETPYSRNADGLAVLRSSIREHLCSEAMHHLGIPTTRSLSLMLSGDIVERDMMYDGNPQWEKGAIVCRVAESFIRFGNFEILAAQRDMETLKKLADYTIENYFPEIDSPSTTKYVDFFRTVSKNTLKMIVHWQRVGFVHGVMNTDNMSIFGLSIDYGPYGFLDPYDPNWTPNTTDRATKRYRFGQQAYIAQWNLYQLANALYPLVNEAKPFEEILVEFSSEYEREFLAMMKAKIGLELYDINDAVLIETLLKNMEMVETDYTIFFRLLGFITEENFDQWESILLPAFYDPNDLKEDQKKIWLEWMTDYSKRLVKETNSSQKRLDLMNKTNPKYILRNYMAQLAIDQANKGSYDLISEFYQLLQKPYDEQGEMEKWFAKRPDWARNKIGCSMLSCSS